MPGRYKNVPNVEQAGERKYLLVRVPAAFKAEWSKRCRELGIPQATYLRYLFECDFALPPAAPESESK